MIEHSKTFPNQRATRAETRIVSTRCHRGGPFRNDELHNGGRLCHESTFVREVGPFGGWVTCGCIVTRTVELASPSHPLRHMILRCEPMLHLQHIPFTMVGPADRLLVRLLGFFGSRLSGILGLALIRERQDDLSCHLEIFLGGLGWLGGQLRDEGLAGDVGWGEGGGHGWDGEEDGGRELHVGQAEFFGTNIAMRKEGCVAGLRLTWLLML
mmetsp:Transcript_24680/g.68747  ORF Transcript_24680/g.68747 Transcript_24680/m.68747 type:complete len:212 (+) Transcript_24680:67-702(+)